MKTSNKAAKRYFARMKRQLICSAQSRDEICMRSMQLMDDFAAENPEAQYLDFVSAFGEPDDYASDAIAVLSIEEIQEAKHRKKVIHRAIWSFSVILLLLVAICWMVRSYHAQQIIDDAPVFYVERDTTHTITEEEFERHVTEKDR